MTTFVKLALGLIVLRHSGAAQGTLEVQCLGGPEACPLKSDSLLQQASARRKFVLDGAILEDEQTHAWGKGGKGGKSGKGNKGGKGGKGGPTPAPVPAGPAPAPAGPAPAPVVPTPAPATGPTPAPTVTIGPIDGCPAPGPPSEITSVVYPHELMTVNCPGFVMTTSCMTKDTYKNIVSVVSDMLNSLDSSCAADDCPQADWAGCVLRMAGHDFMDFDSLTGGGGSDACTDMTHGDNTGLGPCLHAGEHGLKLRTAYEQFCHTVSLADFLVIAAEAVMSASRQHVLNENPAAPALDFEPQFQFGRTTATTCPGAADMLPNPENGCDAVQTTFLDNMGLDWRTATALMGVHSLGRAHPANSGYAGWWSDPENSRRFNNDYFVSLRNKGWVPLTGVCSNSFKNQWIRSGPEPVPTGAGLEMMLDTDMCLAYSHNGAPVKSATADGCCGWQRRFGNRRALCGQGRKPDCGSRRVLEGAAGSHVETFASDESAWLVAFQEAWAKATTNGFSSLSPLADSCPA